MDSMQHKEILPLLEPYLEDTRNINLKDLRACDHACLAMERILNIQAPQPQLPFKDGAERDAALRDFEQRRFRLLKETAQ
jgi:hypothetical protein